MKGLKDHILFWTAVVVIIAYGAYMITAHADHDHELDGCTHEHVRNIATGECETIKSCDNVAPDPTVYAADDACIKEAHPDYD